MDHKTHGEFHRMGDNLHHEEEDKPYMIWDIRIRYEYQKFNR